MFISQAVALRTAELLKEKKLSKYALCKKTGIPKDTLKNIFKNKSQSVNLKTVILISYGLDISPCEFLQSSLFDYDNLTID